MHFKKLKSFCVTFFLFFSTTTSGQYDGKGKPLPEYHAKISGFDERVCFLSLSLNPMWY